MFKILRVLGLSFLIAACSTPSLGANQPTDFQQGLWRGVTVHKSTPADVRQILGEPNEQVPQLDSFVYRQSGRQIVVEFVDGVVEIITANYQEVRVTTQMQVMPEVLQVLGKPDWVTWSPLEESRTLIWAQQGVAVTVLMNRLNVDASQNLIRALDLFPAAALADYKQSHHFRTRVPPTNPNEELDGKLGKVEDPFKWELWSPPVK
jgi:hypothetical protein